MTSRQGTGRGQEPTSKIATPKVPIHPFMNVRLRVRDVCCGVRNSCGDCERTSSVDGTSATCRAARTKAAFNPEADIGAPGPPGLIYEFTA